MEAFFVVLKIIGLITSVAVMVAIGVGIHELYDAYFARHHKRRMLTNDHNRYQQETEIQSTFAAEMLPHIRSGAALLTDIPGGKLTQYTKPKQIINQLPAPTTEVLPELWPILERSDNILIVGGKGSGKTSLMKRIELFRIDQGDYSLVLDSHSQPNKWKGHVIGIGRDYGIIIMAMQHLIVELHSRYTKFGEGQRTNTFDRITCFVDEFTALPDRLKKQKFDIQEFTVPLLTEGRKVDLFTCFGVHSDKVKFLGMQNAGDLIENFDVVAYLHNVDGHHYATINMGDGHNKSLKYGLPEPIRDISGESMVVTTFTETATSEPIPALIESERDKAVRMTKEGLPMGVITMALWGKVGGGYNNRLKKLLK